MNIQDSFALFIMEVINVFFNILFLALFIYRYMVLRSFSKTDRFKDYFPKLRIFFSIVYILVNLAILIETILFSYSSFPIVDIVLVAAGEGMQSIILFVQLFVLRLQLLKQQPYTAFHIVFFFYLSIFSIARFLIFLFNQQINEDIVNIVLSSVLIIDSYAQLLYWFYKKQSLPQFLVPTNAEIDLIKKPSRFITNAYQNTQKSIRRGDNDNFPYIIPFVTVQNSKIKIILQILSTQQSADRSLLDSPALGISKQSSMLTPLNRATRQQQTNRSFSQSKQILSIGLYSIQQIQHLYILCSRFPMNKSINFQTGSLPDLAKQLQQFLHQMFTEKRFYQAGILKYLKIPIDKFNQYNEYLEKFSDSNFNRQNDLDQTLGMKIQEDKSCFFFSITFYKNIWVSDHYEFYIKVISKETNKPYYPIKRFSEFQDLHNNLKYALRSVDKHLLLPALPKKHLFHWNEDESLNQRKMELQKYSRILFNDYTLIQIPAVKELLYNFIGVEDQIQPQAVFQEENYKNIKIVKGEIIKCLVKNQFITYYQFKIFQEGVEIQKICKRFSQFQQLHYELERWMNNIQITYRSISLPQKIYFKSQITRHQKLRIYLQNIVQIRDIYKVYAVNSFFYVDFDEIQKISQISFVNSRLVPEKSQPVNVINEVIELTQRIVIEDQRISESSESSRRFSQIMNNLGNEQYD